MAYDQKAYQLVEALKTNLGFLGLASTISYDTNSDVVLTVTDSSSNEVIRVLRAAQIASGNENPITGTASTVFSPHIIEVGLCGPAAATGTAAIATGVGGVQASGSVTLASVVATDTVVINGVTFTAVAAAPGANKFLVGADDAESAANLAAAIIASASAGVAGIDAAVDGTTAEKVNLNAKTPGVAGNAYTLADGGSTHFTVSGAVFANGAAGDVLTINGVPFYCVDNAGELYANMYFVGATGVACAANLLAAVNISVSVGVSGVVTASLDPADATNKTVLLTAVTPGAVGNIITLAEAGTGITISGALFTGGSDTATSTVTQYKVFSQIARCGTAIRIYQTDSAIAVTDFVAANLVLELRNPTWGNIIHV